MNPVDSTAYTRPLIKSLHRHVDACAATLTGLPAARRGPVAAAWVYMSAVVAWAEAHYLIDPWLSATSSPVMRQRIDATGGMRAWLLKAVGSLAVHPSTQCLANPLWTPIAEATPSEDACRDLVEWWITDAPSLAHVADTGPPSISGWLIGDLLQHVNDERRLAHALAQTPWWVADLIIDRTLIPAARDFRDETLKLIDPTCGTGHMLSRAIPMLWDLYTTGSLPERPGRPGTVADWTPVTPAVAIERIVAGVTGVEFDPLTAAVARLRTLVQIGDLMHRAGLIPSRRLDAIPRTVRPRIAVADSLLAGQITWTEYAKHHPQHAAIYGNPHIPVGQLDLFAEVAA